MSINQFNSYPYNGRYTTPVSGNPNFTNLPYVESNYSNEIQYRGLTGRYIQKNETIQPREIPMDGNFGFFPCDDMSQIIVKRWNDDGSVTTLIYKPEQAMGVFEQTVLSKLDNIEKKIKQKPYRNNNYKNKKGEMTNE